MMCLSTSLCALLSNNHTASFIKHYGEACFTQPSLPGNQENSPLLMSPGKKSECGGNVFASNNQGQQFFNHVNDISLN